AVRDTGDDGNRDLVVHIVERRRSCGHNSQTIAEDLDDLGRQRQTRIHTLRAVENLLEGGDVLRRLLRGVDRDESRRTVTITDRNRRRRDLVAERHRLRRLVDRGTSLLRRRRKGAVDKVDLVTIVSTNEIVTDQRTVREAEGTTGLLCDADARAGLLDAVALLERVRVREALDRRAELLSRNEVEVLDV